MPLPDSRNRFDRTMLRETQKKEESRRLGAVWSDAEAMSVLASREQGQELAMRVLFERNAPRLMQHLRFRFNLPESVAEDLTAHAFLRAYERAAGFRGECEVSSWLIQIARNLALDYLRREKRVEALEDEDFIPDGTFFCELSATFEEPHGLLARKQVDQCVRERFAVFRLRHPEAATALWERHVNETSPQEITALLGRTYGATCQFLSEWGKKLRQYVASCYAMLKEE